MAENKESVIWDRLKKIRADRAAKGKDGGQMVASSEEVVVKEDDESQEDFLARVQETFHTEELDSTDEDVDA